MKYKKILNFTSIIAFVSIIILPFLMMLKFGKSNIDSELNENRKLKNFPAFSEVSLSEYKRQFESYFNDRFGFRDSIIHVNNYLKYAVLNLPNDKVIFGRNGWLFIDIKEKTEDIFGKNPWSQKELETWKKILIPRYRWFTERGIIYIFMVIPNKSTIYPEFLPYWMQQIRGESRLIQLKKHMNTPLFTYIHDITDDILKIKNRFQLYYIYDTHWNDYGALYGTRALLRIIKDYSNVQIELPTEHNFIRRKFVRSGDLPRLLGLEKDMKEEAEALIPVNGWHSTLTEIDSLKQFKWHPQKNNRHSLLVNNKSEIKQKNIIIIHDSFFQQNFPKRLISEKFHKALFLRAHIEDFSFDEIINKFNPSVVVEIRSERWLYTPK